MSVAIVVHAPALSGERWKATDATPEPVSPAVPESARLLRRYWPGSVSVPVGRGVVDPHVRGDVGPRVAGHVGDEDAQVVEAIGDARRVHRLRCWIVVHEEAPAGERWKATEATPLVASAAVAVSAIVPRTLAPVDGAVSEAAGAVRSSVTVTTASAVWPALSVATAFACRTPSPGSVQAPV